MRIRHCIIDYVELDGTILIYERPIPNSGYSQNEILKRQRVRKDFKNPDSDFITLEDLKVQCSVDMYATKYNIYGCTKETRQRCEQKGIQQLPDVPNEDVPSDEYT